MGTGASVPTTAEEAKAAGFTQAQIDEYVKQQTKRGEADPDTENKCKEPTAEQVETTPDAKEEVVTASSKSDSEVLSATEAKPDTCKKSKSDTVNVAESSEAAVAADAADADTNSADNASKDEGEAPMAKSESTEPSVTQLNALFDATTPTATTTRKIRIKYSRYNDEFECRGGAVRWADINDEYAISFVFKGVFEYCVRRVSKGMKNNDPQWKSMPLLPKVTGKEGLDPDSGERSSGFDETFFLVGEVGEDEEELWLEVTELGQKKKEFVSFKASEDKDDLVKSNRAVTEMTSRLKELSKIPGGLESAEARELIAVRDLEDVLYSGC